MSHIFVGRWQAVLGCEDLLLPRRRGAARGFPTWFVPLPGEVWSCSPTNLPSSIVNDDCNTNNGLAIPSNGNNPGPLPIRG